MLQAPFTTRVRRLFTVVDKSGHGERLEKLRTELGLSAREAAKRTGGAVSHVHLRNIERGISPWPKVQLEILEGLARAYDMPLTRLLDVATGRTSEVKELPEPQVGKRSIPVYNLVSAGNGADGGEIVGTMEIDANKRGNRIGYQIDGDSMLPRIYPGARVEVLLQDTAQPGTIIVAYTAEHGMVCKLLNSITPDGYAVLTSYNEKYPPLIVSATEMHIKGTVTEIRNPAPTPDAELN